MHSFQRANFNSKNHKTSFIKTALLLRLIVTLLRIITIIRDPSNLEGMLIVAHSLSNYDMKELVVVI